MPNMPKLSKTIALNAFHIETVTLVTLANWCMIVALPTLHLALLAFVYLAVSVALIATKTTFRAKKSATFACMLI